MGTDYFVRRVRDSSNPIRAMNCGSNRPFYDMGTATRGGRLKLETASNFAWGTAGNVVLATIKICGGDYGGPVLGKDITLMREV
jgi:hypothetical protein